MRRKIALLIRNLDAGGAERVTAHLANGLVQRDYDVDLVLLERTGPYLASVADGARIVELRRRGAMASIPKLVRYLRASRPDVLLAVLDTHSVAAIVAARLSRMPVRVIVTIHQAYSRYLHPDCVFKLRVLFRAVKWLFPRADAIVAVSRGAAEEAAGVTGIPAHLFRTIYNPVIMPEIDELARAPVDHPWFAPGGPGVILAVGSLIPLKAHDVLMRAFALLHKSRPERLMILGEGPERRNLERLVQELGLTESVALPGFVKNPFAYMAKASPFVLSSEREALPTVVIEALAVGTPVVSTNCPHGPAEILDDGKYGELVSVGDAAALAQAMEASLIRGRRPVPAAVLRPYMLDYAVDQYCRLISEMLSAASR